MQHIEVHRSVDPALVDQVEELAAAAENADGFRFLSDHLWLDLHHGGADGFAAAAAHDADGRLAAYAQASEANSGSVVESTVAPGHRHRADLEQLVLEALFGHLATRDAADITWWAHDVNPAHDATAAALGLSPIRGLLQMRRPLPTGLVVEIDTRAYDPARDEESWLAVNNRAFATHGEQGGWDLATLRQRESEDWFDPDGFRIHERDGKMAAFCWTKLHRDHEPPVGEIYVIAVDPAFHGLGLGRQLTLAGLESIYARGVTTAMLFVDADNTAAIGLYQALGFEIQRTDRAYSAYADPTANPSEEAP